MVRANKRLPSSVSVSQAALSGASSSLQSLPAKPKESWSLREAVSVLQESISAALAKGYSYEEVAKMLSGKGVDISASSLKSYLSAARRQQGVATTRRKKTAVQKDEAVASLNGAAAPKTTRRTGTKSKPIAVTPEPPTQTAKRQPKAAAPATRKTAAKAKPAAKTTTKKVASAKTTPTRSRKKS
jgi:hypothetical protein